MCDILWPEVQAHSDDRPLHASGPRSACALVQARPTMSCIHLVRVAIYIYLIYTLKRSVLCTFNFQPSFQDCPIRSPTHFSFHVVFQDCPFWSPTHSQPSFPSGTHPLFLPSNFTGLSHQAAHPAHLGFPRNLEFNVHAVDLGCSIRAGRI